MIERIVEKLKLSRAERKRKKYYRKYYYRGDRCKLCGKEITISGKSGFCRSCRQTGPKSPHYKHIKYDESVRKIFGL